MSKTSEPQKINLGLKHAQHIKKTKSLAQNSDGFVTFAVGERYKILEAIGTGAYGVVCSAVDARTKQHVAIKKIVSPFEILTTAKRTLRELKLLLHFKHDNVVGIKNIIQSNEKNHKDVYLIMDLMESDLHHIIRSDQLLTSEHVCYFLYQLLRGLKYIHSANVIHRDLKPSNLLVNENCELKIGDFGMARGVSSTPQDHKLFMTEYVATRWYRAPELMLSIGEYSQAIDMWSVGCIFAEMMGRKQIFPGRHYVHQLQLVISVLGSPANELVRAIRSDRVRSYVSSLPHKEPVKLKTLYPRASVQMLELLQSFLQFDPQKRPTAEQALSHPFFTAYHDIDDEPSCSRPFDFRFESTVTKSDVCKKVDEVIANYQERKNRLSMQLMKVNGFHKSACNGACLPGANTIPLSSHSLENSTTLSVFKMPPVPVQSHKAPATKPDHKNLVKPILDDVDMKSATSVCSMESNVIDLTDDSSDVKTSGSITSLSPSGEDDNLNMQTKIQLTSTPSLPIITVQVMQDGVVDLTGSDEDADDTEKVKHQTIVQKKDSEQSAAKKKSTISEDTKMKIRDTIFAHIFAKQKGLGKPLDKVKKTVTAAERHRVREEKRKKKLERAAQKERKREEEEKQKNPLSEDDKNLLDRWTKMQETISKNEEHVTEQSLRPEKTRTFSSKSRQKEKLKKSDIIRRQSLPSSFNRYQASKASNTNATSNFSKYQSPAYNSSNENRILSVYRGDGENEIPQHSNPNSHNTNSGSECVFSFQLHTEPTAQRQHNGFITATYSNSFSESSLSRPTNEFTLPVSVSKHLDFSSNGFLKSSATATIKPVAYAQQFTGKNDVIAAQGGVFVPENIIPSTTSVTTTENIRNRPTLLFPSNTEPKIFVGTDLLTPGKILQQTGTASTPQGRNLATLSPDTIEHFLNVDLHKPTNLESPRHPSKQNRPSSYPSLTSPELEDLATFALPLQAPNINTSFRSHSFTHAQNNQDMPDFASLARNRASTCQMPVNSSVSFPFSQELVVEKDTCASHSYEFSPSSFLKANEHTASKYVTTASAIEKRSGSNSSFEFSPSSFLKEDERSVSSYVSTSSVLTNVDSNNGGVFVPHLDTNTALNQPRGQSVMMSDALSSAGAVSATGYGLGVDITDIIPGSAGDISSSGMDYFGDQTDPSLLSDWLDVSCLCPQDMAALQRELELGSPMMIDES